MLITGEGHIKLTDFGLSRMGLMDSMISSPPPPTPHHLANTTLTKNTEQENIFEWKKKSGGDLMETYAVEEGAVGTPDYIAPEVFLSTGYGNAHLPYFIFYHVLTFSFFQGRRWIGGPLVV